jgi:magnesium-transporting ATPase (P-type)
MRGSFPSMAPCSPCPWPCVFEQVRVHVTVFLTATTLAHVAVLQRMSPWPSFLQPYIGNKYVVWLTAGGILRQARPWLEASLQNEASKAQATTVMWIVFVGTLVSQCILGWYKCYGPGASPLSKDASKTAA